MPRRYGSRTAHTNRTSGRRPKHHLPVVRFRTFSHFSECTSPADNPSATGTRSGAHDTISKFRPPPPYKWAPGGLQSTATPDRHHRLLDLRRWLRCPAPVPAHAARPLRAISTLISVSFPTDDALEKPEIANNLDHRSTTYRDLIRDGSDAPGCVRRSRADALVPLGAI